MILARKHLGRKVREHGVAGQERRGALSAAVREHLAAASLLGENVVRTSPLRNLLREMGITRVDLLQIDTEGYDYEVLRTFPFDLSLPVLICFEHLSSVGTRSRCSLIPRGQPRVFD